MNSQIGRLAIALCILLPTSASAQSTYSLLAASGDTIATEQTRVTNGTVSTEVRVPRLELYFSISASGTGREKTFVLDGVSKGAQQRLQVDRRGDELSAIISGSSGNTSFPSKQLAPNVPFLVYMNFALTFAADQLAHIDLRVGESQKIQVLTIDKFDLQDWSVRKAWNNSVELTAPNGQMLVFAFDKQQFIEATVPGQGLRLAR